MYCVGDTSCPLTVDAYGIASIAGVMAWDSLKEGVASHQ